MAMLGQGTTPGVNNVGQLFASGTSSGIYPGLNAVAGVASEAPVSYAKRQ